MTDQSPIEHRDDEEVADLPLAEDGVQQDRWVPGAAAEDPADDPVQAARGGIPRPARPSPPPGSR